MDGTLNQLAAMTGGWKIGKSRITTGQLVAAGLVLTCLTCLGTAAPASADFTLKVGGSGISNWSSEARQGTEGLRQAGGHISLDYALPQKAIVFSPFVDAYHRGGSGERPRYNMSTNVIGGLNFLYFIGPRGKVTTYLGAGGGVTRMKVTTNEEGAAHTTGYKIKPMATALMGLEVRVQKRTSIFFEPHYLRATKMLNGVSAHAGLAFDLSKAEAAPQVRPPTAVYVPTPVRPAPQPPPQPVKVVQPVQVKAADTGSLDTMREMVYFEHDKSDISDAAKTILDDKVVVFRSNPGMRILIVGFASQPGTDTYNMALGMRRSEAAKGYLVSQGVDPTRIEIATRGENQLVVEGPGEVADEQNRRDQFRLLITDPVAAPKH